MRITKFVHACLLVEMPASGGGRTALFDPGVYSTLDPAALSRLDDIFITHAHADHMDTALIKKLTAKFPDVTITATSEAVRMLQEQGIRAGAVPPEGASLFDSPHEAIRPFFDADPPQEIGVHYLDLLSHPGDSHSFHETKPVLALPVQAPWGAPTGAVRAALELRPKYVVPIHDWHWSDAARKGMYDSFEQAFKPHGITFIKAVNGEPFVLDV